MSLKFVDLGLEPFVARLETADLLGESVDLALLQVGVWRPVERLPTESFFKEPEEIARPLQPSLVDLKGHPSGQVRRHVRSPSGGNLGIGKGVLYF